MKIITYKHALESMGVQQKKLIKYDNDKWADWTRCEFEKEKSKAIIKFTIMIYLQTISTGRYIDYGEKKLTLRFKINSNDEITDPSCCEGEYFNTKSNLLLVDLLQWINSNTVVALPETKEVLNDIFSSVSKNDKRLYEKPEIVVSGYIREVFNFNKESHREKYITTFFPPNEVIDLVTRKIAGGPSWKPFLFRPKAINNVNKSLTRDEASIAYKGIDNKTRSQEVDRSIEPQQDQTSIFRCCIL